MGWSMASVWTLVFLSSRRRHTRLVSVWSSDVCSSDLPGRGEFLIQRITLHPRLQNFPDAGLLADGADLLVGRVRLRHLHVGAQRIVKESRELRHHRDVIVKIVGCIIAHRSPAQEDRALLWIVKTKCQFEEGP